VAVPVGYRRDSADATRLAPGHRSPIRPPEPRPQRRQRAGCTRWNAQPSQSAGWCGRTSVL